MTPKMISRGAGFVPRRRCCGWLAVIILAVGGFSARAQWLTQPVTVSQGWTAAYLFVDASSNTNLLPQTPNLPLSPDNPIDQIWLWKVPAGTAQYINNPSSPLSAGGQWVSWAQTNLQNTLAVMIPNAAYLIHSTAATNYTWNIQGQPTPPSYTWDLTGLNFLGFSTPAGSPPSLQSFFAPDAALVNVLQVYDYPGGELSATNPALVPNAGNLWSLTPVNPGQAFWFSTVGVNNTYYGPFSVNLPNPAGLAYGSANGQQTFHLINQTAANLTITMTFLASEPAPHGQTPVVSPPPLLLEGSENLSNLTFACTALSVGGSSTTTNTSSWTLAPAGQPGSDIAVTLGVNRFAMASPAGSLYAGILQFTDSLGLLALKIPVSATAANNNGLWIGSASVNQVGYDLKTYATNADGSLMLSPVSSNTILAIPFNLTGTTSNQLVNQTYYTNAEVDTCHLTNVVVSVYSSNATVVITNGWVQTTNTTLTSILDTNTVIVSTVTGFMFDANNNIIWITTTTTNVTSSTSFAAASVTVTNLVAPVPVNGSPMAATNVTFNDYFITNVIVTNGPFLGPVTNWVVGNYLTTNLTIVTSPVYNHMVTNQPSLVLHMATNTLATNYVIYQPAQLATAPMITTNSYAGNPLLVLTNGNQMISLNIATNLYQVYYKTNWVVATTNSLSTNFFLISGSGAQVATNLFASTAPQLAGTAISTLVEVNASNSFLSPLWVTNPVYIYSNVITSFSNYVVTAHNTSLDAVAAPFPLRLILFNDTNGNCSLLQRIYIGLNSATNLVLSTTQNTLNPNQLGTARRITTTQLPWTAANQPIPCSGGGLAEGATLSATITEPYDDQAANPFLHTYHPDHNNLNFANNPPTEEPPGVESYTVQRVIQLNVVAAGNDFLSLTTANSSLSGTYGETITLFGLGGNSRTYTTAGTFALKQISAIPVLNTQ